MRSVEFGMLNAEFRVKVKTKTKANHQCDNDIARAILITSFSFYIRLAYCFIYVVAPLPHGSSSGNVLRYSGVGRVCC